MTLNKLASAIAKREGKKSQARIGDIREILGVIADIVFEGTFDDHKRENEFWLLFNEAGSKRARRYWKDMRKIKANSLKKTRK